MRSQRDKHDNRRIVMYIYDSESNVWTGIFMTVPDHIQPYRKGIYSHGKFHWAARTPNPQNLIVAFNIADGLWTAIPVPEGCGRIFPENLGEHDGKLVLVDLKEVDFVRLWKLNEAEIYEIWCELRPRGLSKDLFPLFPLVTVNSSGLIVVVDWKINISIFNFEGKLIVPKLTLLGLRTSQRPSRGSGSAFESNNLWWP